MWQRKYADGAKVKVVNGIRKGEIGTVVDVEYVGLLKEWRYKVEFDNNSGLIPEKDLITV